MIYYSGIIIGLIAFISIGIFHPIVVKSEFYFGKNVWPFFLIFGTILVLSSIFVSNIIISSCLAIVGFSSLWSIRELFEQEERVGKGWFPANPNKIKKENL
ncbi:MAG: DUF4491 family protein [Candidatus Hodarchaeales archaeon]|jgi:hypothetical protein